MPRQLLEKGHAVVILVALGRTALFVYVAKVLSNRGCKIAEVW